MPDTTYSIEVAATDWRIGSLVAQVRDFNNPNAVIAGTSPAIVGGSAALADGSDASFARITNQTLNAAPNGNMAHGLFPGIPDSMVPQAVKDAYANVIAGTSGWSVTVQNKNRTRAITDVGSANQVGTEVHNSRVNGSPRYVPNATSAPLALTTSETFNFPVGTAANFGVHAQMRASGVILLTPVGRPTAPSSATLRVMEWAWVVNWTVTSPDIAPVTRRYPRDDGRGMSSAPRLFPPSRSARMVGGYQ